MTNQDYEHLGKPRKLLEGLDKITGRTEFAANVSVPGMLHVRPILSPYAHAKILSIDTSDAENMPGVVAVLTAQDLPTRDRVISSRNSSILAKDEVVFRGQPVVAVVGESEAVAQDAAEMVYVDYEPLPAVVDLAKAVTDESPITWPNGLPKADEDITAAHASVDKSEEKEGDKIPNVHDETHQSRGDVEKALSEADVVVERSYKIPIVHQTYMEPHAAVAIPDPYTGELTVYSPNQGQYAVRGGIAGSLGMPSTKVKVIPTTLGGGFGAKYGIIEPMLGAVAQALKKPVKMVLTRSEDFLTTTPAPACNITVTTGATKDGDFTALKVHALIDNGVFGSPWGGIFSLLVGGFYAIDNVQIDCYEVNTHKPQTGAYRAPGAPQASFTLESNVDDMCEQLGIDPMDFRLKNAVEEGDLRGDGQPWPHLGAKECLRRLSEHPAWVNRDQKSENEGIGIAIGGWPCGMSAAASVCKIDNDGIVRIQVGSTDISGLNSSMPLIAAEILGVSPDEVEIIQGNTSTGLYGPVSGGSQATSTMASAVQNAATEVRTKLVELAADHFEASTDDIELKDSKAQVKGVPDSSVPIATLATMALQGGGPGPLVGEGTTEIGANAPGFVAHLAKVKVDPDTGHTELLDFVAVQDVGFALNPMMVEGQIHGGVVQGIGFGLHEAMVYDEDGELLTASFMDYDMPKASVVPNIDAVMVYNEAPNRPFGARGVGEPPIVAPAAAIANAVKNATGVRVDEIPVRPESLWRAMQSNG
ncbi:MAG: xanthine dehydrogenase family protein molybdopterin-binding subunit [Chloroflexota bacterium]